MVRALRIAEHASQGGLAAEIHDLVHAGGDVPSGGIDHDFGVFGDFMGGESMPATWRISPARAFL